MMEYSLVNSAVDIDFVTSGSRNILQETTNESCVVPVTLEGNIAITVSIAFLLALGMIGNVTTIVVVVKNKSLQTHFNLFLLSLCASDLVSACVCSPLWLYRRTWGFHEWNWGQSLCKFYWVSDFTTNFTTSLHILSFCCLRYLAFSRPFTAPTTKFRGFHFRVYITSLWIFSVVLAAPYAYFMGVREKNGDRKDPWPSCSIRAGMKNHYHIYTVIVNSLFFYVPAVLIIILSFFTTRNLRKMTESRTSSRIHDPGLTARMRVRNKAACRQLQLICTCFMFGYVPVGIYLIWATKPGGDGCETYIADYWFGVASYLVLRVSECLNPVMYNIGCTEMRKATLNFVKYSIFRKATRTTRVPTVAYL